MRQIAFIVLLAVFGLALSQNVTELKSGVYSEFNLDNHVVDYFKLRVHEKRLAPIDISVTPLRCNGPINIYASFKEENPTAATAQFRSSNAKTMSQTTLNIPEELVKPKDGYLHIGVEFKSMLGKLSCTGQMVALLNHYQSMVRVVQGYSTVSNFSTLLDVHHFYEFTVNETSATKPGHLGIIATGLNRNHPYDDELQVYISTKTSRPLPTNFQWQGLLVDDGAFAAILHTDPEYVKDGRYWLGVSTQAAHRPVPYSVMVFHLGGDNAREIFLNDNQYQVGFSMQNEYTYFYAYCDATANGLTFKITPKFGTATMFLSTHTQRPTSSNYEMKGTVIEFPAQSETFVYIGVIPDAGSPPLAAYDIVVTRN